MANFSAFATTNVTTDPNYSGYAGSVSATTAADTIPNNSGFSNTISVTTDRASKVTNKGSWVKGDGAGGVKCLLLLEDACFIRLEDGCRLLLEDSNKKTWVVGDL